MSVSLSKPPSLSARWNSPGAALWWRGALLIQISIIISYVLLWSMLAWRDELWRNDFIAFYSAGAMVLAGEGGQIYDLDAVLPYQQATLAGRFDVIRALPFANPPHIALLMAPLAVLPFQAAFYLWTGIQIGLIVWAARLAFRGAGWSRKEQLLLSGAILAFPPLFSTIVVGAFSLILLVCMWQFYHALRSGRPGSAGMWLVLGLIKPQVWILLVVMLLAARQWRALAGATGTGTAIVLSSSSVLGWRSWPDWLALLERLPQLHRNGQGIDVMYNIRGTLTLWLGGHQEVLLTRLTWLVVAVAVGAVAWLWWRRWHPGTLDFTIRLALTITLGVLVSPHLNPHDSVLLVVPAILGYLGQRQLAKLQVVFTAVMVISPLLFLLSSLYVGTRFGIQTPVIMMIGLILWFAYLLHGSATSRATARQDGELITTS